MSAFGGGGAGSDDLHPSADAALAVDSLAALFGLHPGAEADRAGALGARVDHSMETT